MDMTSDRIKQKQRPLPRQDQKQKDPARPKAQAFASVMSQTKVQKMPEMQRHLGEHAEKEDTRERGRDKKGERKAKRRSRGETKATQHGGGAEGKGERVDSGPKHRVVVKVGEDEGQGKGGDRGGQSSGGGGRGESGPRSKSAENVKQYAQAKTDLSAAAATKFQQTLAAQQKAPAELNTKQMQQLVNLMVQAIRLGKNEVGQTELHVAFQAAVFKGLRLRLTEKDGKVAIAFESDDPGVRALFRKERKRIRKALTAKGIDIEGIEVVA